jgi:Flp pilus assembly pilin Flp
MDYEKKTRGLIAEVFRRFSADTRGATMIEYGLFVALISVALIGVLFGSGASMRDAVYGRIVTALGAM